MSTLYLVATPIGNLSDMTHRAIETLTLVDFVAAEDTRVTMKLLNRYQIQKPLISYYEHNIRQRGQQIVARILAGESCALVTDAGMPAISDPGEDLVRLCAQSNIPVVVIPGPCAAVCGLALSGLPTARFCFEGFLSTNKLGRREHLESLATETRTMIFYEAPHKLRTTLDSLKGAFGGDRRISLCRELTKIHEETLRLTIAEAITLYQTVAPRGEYVLVLEGCPLPAPRQVFLEDAVSLAKTLQQNGLPPAAAAKEAARITGCKKSDIYRVIVDCIDTIEI